MIVSMAHKPAALAQRISHPARIGGARSDRLWLRNTGDDWSLLDCGGGVLFRGLGLAGRRQCLEFASSRGVLAVLS
jgi:hypothetical protein